MGDNNDKIITVASDGAEDMCPQVSFDRRNELAVSSDIEEIMTEAKALADAADMEGGGYNQMDAERTAAGLSSAVPLTDEPLLQSDDGLRVRLRIRDANGGCDPYQGVDPDDFVLERTRLHFVHQLGSDIPMWGPAHAQKHAWRELAKELNAHLAEGQLEINYNEYRCVREVAIGLGGGKSTGLSVYAGCLSAMAGSPKNCPGMILVCERIKDVQDLADSINRYANEWYGAQGEFAIGWHHRVNEKWEARGLDPVEYKDLSRFPFLVCTQKALTYALAVEAIDRFRDKRLTKFMQYDYHDPKIAEKFPHGRWNADSPSAANAEKGRKISRIGIVFDEAIQPFYSYAFDKELLLRLDDMLDPEGLPEWMGRKHAETIEQLGLLGFEMDRQSNKQGRNNALEGTKPKSNTVVVDMSRFAERKKLEAMAELMSDIHDLKFVFNGFEKWNLIQDLANVFFVLQESDPLFYWRTTKFKKKQFQFSQFIVHRLGRGFVCLDATAGTSQLGSVYRPRVIRDDIGATQDFAGLTFLIDESRGCSRGSMNGEPTKEGEKLKAKGKDVPYTEYTEAPKTVDLLWTNIKSHWKSYLAKAIGYEAVGEMLAKGKRPQIGVIAFKPVAEGIEAMKKAEPDVCTEVDIITGNIGGVRGSNKFRKCQVLWVNGINYKSYDWMKETRHGLDRYIRMLEETDLPMSGDTLYRKDTIEKIKSQIPERDRDLYHGALIEDTLQTVGRSAARTSTHELPNGLAACTPAVVLLNLKHRGDITLLMLDALRNTFEGCTIVEHGWRLDPKSKDGKISKHGLKVAKKLMSEGPTKPLTILKWCVECLKGDKPHPIGDIVIDYFRPKGMPRAEIKSMANNMVTNLTARISKQNKQFMKDHGIETAKGQGSQQEDVWMVVKDQ
jgi:hypothetical protein